MNIDDNLNILIEKYSINNCYNCCNLKIKAENLINNLLNKIDRTSNIAIYGGGEHTENLLKIISKNNLNIKFIVDKNPKEKKIKNIPCVSLNSLDLNKVDIIIISSFKYRYEIFEEICNIPCKIIDIYDWLEFNNLKLEKPWYAYKLFNNSDYIEVYYNKKKFLTSYNSNIKEFYLERLIYNYLEIRDFLNAINTINIYVANQYSKSDIYTDFSNELKILLNDIKLIFKNRNCNDIIVNWIDSLRYDELNDMEFLSEISKKSFLFENSFTTVAHTKGTIDAIFKNQLSIDSFTENLKQEKIDLRTSSLLKLIHSNNYICIYIGSERFCKMFSSSDVLTIPIYETLYSGCRALWLLLKTIIDSSKPCCIFTHILHETHPPYLCGTLNNLDRTLFTKDSYTCNTSIAQLNTSKKYIDTQLRFYMDFLEYKNIKIYMSDHGKELEYTVARYTNKWLHTLLLVNFPDKNFRLCKGLFSYLNFDKLFKYIFNRTETNYDDLFRDEIEIQALDTYSQEYVEWWLQKSKEMGICLYFARSYRGIITLKDKYICQIGKEYYFVMPNESKNRINEERYKKRIDFLREKAKNYFIDIYKYDFFKYSRKLYE